MRIRKNVKDLSLAEKRSFVSTLLVLKARPSVLHPQLAGRSRYDDYVEIHRLALEAQWGAPNAADFHPGWAHHAPAFLPWHRVMLYAFESDLAATDPAVTLPFWDWTDPASSPFSADFLSTNGDPQDNSKVKDGPFAADGPSDWKLSVTAGPDYLQRDFGDSQNLATALPTAAQVGDVLTAASYEKPPYHGGNGGFRARLEIELHHLVTRWVGGTMVTLTSPNDPVFFLHHANLDRLWQTWEQAHTSPANCLPLKGAAPGHNWNDNITFSNDGSAPFGGPYTPADVADCRNLGYAYNSSRLPSLHRPCPALASAVQTLYGITYDAPGAWVDSQGHIHHGGGGPGDMVWAKLSPAVRDDLTGRAIIELAALTSNREVHAQIARAASALVMKTR